jgi:hypothetical protein
MKLYNNTPGEVFYSISSPGSGDCGTIESGGTSDLPGYDNQQNVRVAFTAMPSSQPPEITPFKITIPDSGTDMAVTIGLYQE